MAQNRHNVLMSTLICLVLTHLLDPRLPTQHLFSDVWRHLKLSKTKLLILHPTSTTIGITTQTRSTPPIVCLFEYVATPSFHLFRSCSRQDLRSWGAYQSIFWGKNSSGRRNSRCKDSEQDECLGCPRTVRRPGSLKSQYVRKEW